MSILSNEEKFPLVFLVRSTHMNIAKNEDELRIFLDRYEPSDYITSLFLGGISDLYKPRHLYVDGSFENIDKINEYLQGYRDSKYLAPTSHQGWLNLAKEYGLDMGGFAKTRRLSYVAKSDNPNLRVMQSEDPQIYEKMMEVYAKGKSDEKITLDRDRWLVARILEDSAKVNLVFRGVSHETSNFDGLDGLFPTVIGETNGEVVVNAFLPLFGDITKERIGRRISDRLYKSGINVKIEYSFFDVPKEYSDYLYSNP